jgi:energy-coupling factor transporter ATP-binding protein EcfA2
MIRLEHVSYGYPEAAQEALSDVELTVEPGELLLVAGESGSGKSTLLRSMNGLIPHFYGGTFSGRLMVDGVETINSRPRELAGRVGFVGQDPENHAVAERVEDDIAFTLENLGVPQATMRKRVEEVLDALGIAALRSRRLDSLSGGERQRVAIASALVAMPAYLVLDEPTSQLDPQSAEEVIGSALRLRDEIGISVILAEHRLERVVQYADRLCVLNGRTLDTGEPAEVLARTELGPPVAALGRALGWHPLPLTLRDARTRAKELPAHRALSADETTPGDTLLELTGVEVNLGSKPVLREIDLDVRESEVVALMGRNGSGKTTLLRAIAGLVGIRKGRVRTSASVALVPQNPEVLLYRRTVADEISATLRARGHPADPERLAAEAQRFEIAHLLERYPRELSSGEKTKAAIAAAAAGHPELLLLDEPTRGMDEPGKRFLKRLLDAHKAAGKAVILATHDVELAARVATRVVLLADGEVVLDGSPRTALAASLTFSTQMNKVFRDPGILTVDDAIRALDGIR